MKYSFALTLIVVNLAASETEPPYSGDYEAYVTFNLSSVFGREVTDPAAGANYLFDGQSSDVLPFSFSTNSLPTESDADLVFEIMESAEGICGYSNVT